MTAVYTDTPRIYVASLSDYNAGRLIGAWIDANQSADEIMDEISAMLATSPEPIAEEWAIHDFDNFGPIRLDEYETIERIADLGAAISEHGEAFAAWSDSTGSSDVAGFMDAYQGEFDSERDYAESMLDDTGMLAELPEWARSYFDIDAWTRDLFMDDYFSITIPNYSGVWIFSNY